MSQGMSKPDSGAVSGAMLQALEQACAGQGTAYGVAQVKRNAVDGPGVRQGGGAANVDHRRDLQPGLKRSAGNVLAQRVGTEHGDAAAREGLIEIQRSGEGAGAHHAGCIPAGKRQGEISGAGRNDDAVERGQPGTRLIRQADHRSRQGAAGRAAYEGRPDIRAEADVDAGVHGFFEFGPGGNDALQHAALVLHAGIQPFAEHVGHIESDKPGRNRMLIDQHHFEPEAARFQRGCKARGTGAQNDQPRVVVDRELFAGEGRGINRGVHVSSGRAPAYRATSLLQRDRGSLRGRRACHHGFVPALHVGEVGQIDLMPFVPPRPAEDGEVSDRDGSADVLGLRQPLVENAVQPPRFFAVSLQPVFAVLLVLDLQEMVHLAEHRAEPAHLPHQPLQNGHLSRQVPGPELAGLGTEIDQDGAGLEDADRFAVRSLGIDDGGDAIVRADAQELRLELLALANVHRVHGVGQTHLLQRDADLAPVRRIPGPKLDRHVAPVKMVWGWL